MIYIQSNQQKTLPHHFDCSCALYGAIDSAIDYRLVNFEEVASGKFDALIKQNLFVGSVEFVREVFKRVGILDVRLPENSNRGSKIITLFEAHELVSSGKKIFIKPLEIKLFTGLVLDGMTYTCLRDLSGTTKVMCYEPFDGDILSEWRIYVDKNKVIDSKNYSGDFTLSPDYGYIDAVIELNKTLGFPSTYIIDIGLLESEENVVIEYNDAWAIGNYGVPNELYLKMLRNRYFDIIRTCSPDANKLAN